ncbi:MAG: sigma-70 family RNA polymerase sigma factor [Bacteroidota bacterium]
MLTNLFEREALSQLEALRHYAFQLCREEQRSNDLVQETMLKACRYFHSYREGTNCRAWLFQICKNTFINEYRRKQYEPLPVDFGEPAAGAGEGGEEERYPHPILRDDVVERREGALFGDEVILALGAIPPDYQTAVLLSDIEGYTYEEIAAFARVPIGTIRSRIHRGRKMLAGHLAEYAQSSGYRSLTLANT